MVSEIEQSRFTDSFVRANRLEDIFTGWLFSPEMLFGATTKWWEEGSTRSTAHEGLDFCLYRDADHRPLYLRPQTLIPAMYGGTIRKIFDDFLGKSLIVEHRTKNGGKPFLTIFGHTRPVQGLSVGRMVGEGEIIATLAEPSSKTPARPHLHVSLLWKGTGQVEGIEWSSIDARSPEVLDPLDVLDGPYHLFA
jgi:hypothetical protein